MATRDAQVPRFVALADRIFEDIRRRQLQPGDPYLGTAETAEMLGVSTSAANLAMQVLVKRRVLTRRQRKGTFVAMPVDEPSGDASLHRVHLLVQENYLRTEGLLADGVVVGMHDELPATQVQFNFFPPDDEVQYIKSLLADAAKARQPEGFVLVRASLDAQRLVAESGLPVVVHGTLHPSVPAVPWIDQDHVEGGRLLATHLMKAGCKHVAVLMRDRMLHGDHQLLDAVRDTMAAGGAPMNALTVRCLPGDPEAIKAAVLQVLGQVEGPIGFICRTEALATGAAAAVEAVGSQRDASIVLSGVYRKRSDAPPRWPHLKPTLTPEQIGGHIGRMLSQQARGEPVQPRHEIIPVYLEPVRT